MTGRPLHVALARLAIESGALPHVTRAATRLREDLAGLVPTAVALRVRSLVASIPEGFVTEAKGAVLLALFDEQAATRL